VQSPRAPKRLTGPRTRSLPAQRLAQIKREPSEPRSNAIRVSERYATLNQLCTAMRECAQGPLWVIFDRVSRLRLPSDVGFAPKATVHWIRELAIRKRARELKSSRNDSSFFTPYPYCARNPVERFFNGI
jgi:hypothetical protein